MPAIDGFRKKLVEELIACHGNYETREALEIKTDFFLSSIFGDLSFYTSDYVWEWFKEKRAKSALKTELIPINKADGWVTDVKTGNIHHVSKKFFSIKGIRVHSEQRESRDWCQPIIDQPEIGILGFLVKKINGIYHFLVQAKEEPGNIGNVQLTTTLMATKSNFEQVHGGSEPHFLRYFKELDTRRVLVNKLQSEEGARFYKKNNLNIVAELGEHENIDIPEMFIWMSLCQIKEFLRHENIVNACGRSVISCLP